MGRGRVRVRRPLNTRSQTLCGSKSEPAVIVPGKSRHPRGRDLIASSFITSCLRERRCSFLSSLPGLLNGPPVASAVEPLLSSRSSCISLLCQTLTHLEEIQHLVRCRSRCSAHEGSTWSVWPASVSKLEAISVSQSSRSHLFIHCRKNLLPLCMPALQLHSYNLETFLSVHMLCSPQVGLSVEFPPQPLLRSVVTVLQFCVGLAVPVSPLGVTLGRILVGAFRVQRAALSLLGALSQWASTWPFPPLPFIFLLGLSECWPGCWILLCKEDF